MTTALETFVGIIVTALCSGAVTLTIHFKMLKSGVLALLHDRIYQACAFYLEREYVTEYDLRNLAYLYNPYHKLGGNDICTEMYERCKKLNIKSIGDVE